MRFRDIVAAAPHRVIVEGDTDVDAIAIDSREVRPGTLFIARRGWYSDGHRYIAAALAAGAAALVISDTEHLPEECPCPVVLVEHEDPALGLMSARFYDHPTRALRVYGVTGTNGKTSTVWMLDHILRTQGRQVALLSTTGYRIGGRWQDAPNTTPDALVIQRLAREAVDAGDEALVMEVSSHGCAHGRVAACAFDVLGFTNFSRDHLDFHGSEEAYFRAKALFFQLYGRRARLDGKQPVAVITQDDAGGVAMCRAALELPVFDEQTAHLESLADASLRSIEPPAVLSLSTKGLATGPGEGAATVHAPDVLADVSLAADPLAGIDVRLVVASEDAGPAQATVPVVGRYQGQNAALASLMASVGDAQLAVGEALDALRSFAGVPGRLERVATPRSGEPVVFVDFAHTPDAVASAAQALAEVSPGGLCVVLGAGGDRDAGKRPLMCAAAVQHATCVILTRDNPRSESPESILAAMRAGASSAAPVKVIADRFAAIEAALRSGCDAVLIAGKGHESYEEIAGRRFAWSDRAVSRALLAQRRWQLESSPYLSGWTLEEIASAAGGELVLNGGDPRELVSSLSSDTRSIDDGGLFVALVGENHDGHDWVGAAVERGASAILVSRAVPQAIPQIVVDDSLVGMQRLSAALLAYARRTRGGLWVRAITGSNGKTTTRAMLEALVRSRDGRPVLATRGNYNNHIGLPLTLVRLGWQHRSAVLEMGANGPGDIAELVQIAPPDVSVITSIGRAHLEGFGSEENIRRTKRELISAAARPRFVIVPCEEQGRGWQQVIDEKGASSLWIGSCGLLEASRQGESGRVTLQGHGPWSGYRIEFELPLVGAHNAHNFATAVAAACAGPDELADPPDLAEIRQAVEAIILPEGRLELYVQSGRQVIFDAYNANPTSMIRALDILAASSGYRLAVLGEMKELGVESDALHREVAEYALRCCDEVVAVGRSWPADIQITHIVEADAAAKHVASKATVGATLLWKGSRGARLERLRDAVESIWNNQAS